MFAMPERLCWHVDAEFNMKIRTLSIARNLFENKKFGINSKNSTIKRHYFSNGGSSQQMVL